MWFAWGIIGLVIWVLIAFWPAWSAVKGHSFIGYFLLSLLFFPLALIMAYVVQDRTRVAIRQTSNRSPCDSRTARTPHTVWRPT